MPATLNKQPVKVAKTPIVVQPAPGLNRLGSKVKINEPAEKPKTDAIPVVQIEGDICKRYNEAKKQEKDAQGVIKELQPVIHQHAMQKIFEHNCAVGAASLASVKLQDFTVDEEDAEKRIPGEVTRVSFTSKYNSCDAAQVDATFGSFAPVPDGKGHLVQRDINEYVVETVTAKFDASVFLDENGDFNLAVYKKFVAGIERIAKEVGLVDAEGKVKSPLGTQKVLKVKETFHDRRFKDFNQEENFTLTAVLPNTIQCVAVRTT